MMAGASGFATAPDQSTLRIEAVPLAGDPLGANLRDGALIAALGIELPTRRRNRVIGEAQHVSTTGFDIRVHHTLGICPKYIQAREIIGSAGPLSPAAIKVHRSAALDQATRAIIAKADTFFVASVDPRAEDGIVGGVDISHRGGNPGFVRIDDDATLTTPDFVGNFKFNTLGNFVIEPRAGLLFVDFDRGGLVYLAARAEMIWDGPEVARFTGAQRLVRFAITEVIHVEESLPLRFSAAEFSPALARTGTWMDAGPAAV